jgi:hypothetical protein
MHRRQVPVEATVSPSQRDIYRALKYANDARAVKRAVVLSSTRPLGRRIARRAYGKATGRLARRWFG